MMSTEVEDSLASSLTLSPCPPGDHDTVEDVGSVYSTVYQQTATACLSLSSCSVVGLAEVRPGMVAGLAHTGRVTCLDLESLRASCEVLGEEETVREVRSHPTDQNLLLTCGLTVKVWDLRDPREAALELKVSSDLPGPGQTSLSCLAASRAGLVVAGTDQRGLDAFLLFWDLKGGGDLLGGYWNVHSDDVTSVEFQDQQQDRLVSAGTDGLVNILDLSKCEEEEALVSSYNSEDSVASVVWRGKEVVLRTHTEGLQSWNPSTCRHQTLARAEVAAGLRRGVEDHVYIAGLWGEENSVSVLAGSRCQHSPCLRSLSLTEEDKLQPKADFLQPGPSIRSCLSLRHRDTSVLTGGDDGVLRLWTLRDSQAAQQPSRKITSETSKARRKPYTK